MSSFLASMKQAERHLVLRVVGQNHASGNFIWGDITNRFQAKCFMGQRFHLHYWVVVVLAVEKPMNSGLFGLLGMSLSTQTLRS